MIDPLVERLVSVAFGLLLAAAAWHKARSFRQFTAVVGDYRLLPRFAVAPAAGLVVLTEAVLAVGWLSNAATAWVAPLTAAMLALYGMAIAINLARGRVHISCGCGLGGAREGDTLLGWGLVARNAVMALLALLPMLPPAPRTLQALDWATLGAALCCLALLHFAAAQLAQNNASIRTWRKPVD